MFSQVSVILFTGTVVADTPLCRHPSWADSTPPPRQTPAWADTPLGRHPPGQAPPEQTPPPRADNPPRWLLQRTVRILRECILVISAKVQLPWTFELFHLFDCTTLGFFEL